MGGCIERYVALANLLLLLGVLQTHFISTSTVALKQDQFSLFVMDAYWWNCNAFDIVLYAMLNEVHMKTQFSSNKCELIATICDWP